VKSIATFVVIGSVFVTAEELLTIAVLRHDLPSYLFTLLVLFPTYLSFVYSSSWILDRLILGEPYVLICAVIACRSRWPPQPPPAKRGPL
jgi:hypothetical protein